MLTAAAGYASGEAFLSGAIARPFSKGLLMWGKTNKFILTLSINWLTLMPEGVHGASAGRSFGYAQDDETGEAEEAAGVHRASADGSFGYAQDDEPGTAVEAAGVHRARAEGSIQQ